VNVRICLDRGRGDEGFRRGGVVAAAFGDVQVAGVFIVAVMAARMVATGRVAKPLGAGRS
jgi:hypothetical protein